MGFNENTFLKENNWLSGLTDPGLLIKYLEITYRDNLWRELPSLIKDLEEIFHDNSFHYPHLKEALIHLNVVYTTLIHHLSEESDLFASLHKTGKGEGVRQSNFQGEQICFMKYEHTIVVEGLSRVRALCENYQLPYNDAVLPAIYTRLLRCETLLLEQICLENNILFEKIIPGKAPAEDD